MLKKVKVVESKCMNNEVTLEELDNNLRQTTKMASDNEQKLDELSRKLGVQEEELKRAIERAELAENKLKGIEEELQVYITDFFFFSLLDSNPGMRRGHLGQLSIYTDKKENQIFLINKEIQSGTAAKSYIRKCANISPYMRRP